MSSRIFAETAMEHHAEQRVIASFILARGKKPSAEELAKWKGSAESRTVSQLVEEHKKEMQHNAALAGTIALRAQIDAFGQESSAVSSKDSEQGRSYAELVQIYRVRLEQEPSAYREVLDRAYRRVVRRSVYDEEVAYWMKFDVMPYVLLVGCIDDWGRRNQPGLMVTAGSPTVSMNSVYLITERLAPKVAEEARAAVGLPIGIADDFSYASRRTVIAPGAGELIAAGGIHFTAAGAPNLQTTE